MISLRKKLEKITQMHGWRIPYVIRDLPMKIMNVSREKVAL